jgi:hypothetical protein
MLMDADVRELSWQDEERVNAFYQRTIEALGRVPGVRGSAAADRSPLAQAGFSTVTLPGATTEEGPGALYVFVSPDYFATIGSHFDLGRSISPEELLQHSPSVVINHAMAELFWPATSAIGKTFEAWPAALFTVVGVVDRTLSQALGSELMPQFYLPLTLRPPGRMTFLVQVERDSAELRRALTQQLSSWWPLPEPPVWRSLDDQVEQSQFDLSAAVRVLLGVALLSSLVSALGLYFFSSFTAALALKEAAVRLALGATWQTLARRQLALYAPTALLGLALGAVLVWGAHPVFRWLDVTMEAPGMRHVALALVPLLTLTLLGLSAPLWRLRRLDVCKTLNLD